MTIEEPHHIGVELYPEQLEQLERAAENHPDVDNVNDLVQLLVADHTGTLDQLRSPGALDVEKIRSLLEWQQELLEDVSEEIDGESDADLDAVRRCLEDVRKRQEEISDELEQRTIY